jgi:signal transduction histidine kinase
MPVESPIDQTTLAAELRAVPAFADLPGSELQWFLSRADYKEFQAGEVVSRAGDEAEYLIVILDGRLQVKAENGMGDGPMFLFDKGRVTGFLPFSRMTTFPLNSFVLEPMRVLMLHKRFFPEMYVEAQSLVPKLVAILTDRVRESTRATTEHGKLVALGKLSAGLAHELNNPAAAARQASGSARQLFDCYRETLDELAETCATKEVFEKVRSLEKEASAKVQANAPVDSLERSDLEETMGTYLDGLRMEHAWKIAPALVDAGFTPQRLESELGGMPPAVRELCIYRIAAAIEMEQVLSQVQTASSRISDLVLAMKDYSFMDRAAVNELDLNHNLETTLKMFGYRFKKGIGLETLYDHSLPKICAHGGQLNQVWTNLIDNALDAVDDISDGRKPLLKIRTAREGDLALVEITDNGNGIPADVASRVFDPFFTTKPQGEGTGLGLDMVFRIVRQHQGDVRFDSKPGQTTFTVRLPIRSKA